jgi:hypothetical protein
MTPPDASSHALPFPGAGARRPAPRANPRPAAAQGLVAERLRARGRRIKTIRRRVVGIAAAMFLATSGGITLQLVSGNDPALAKSAAKTTAAASTASTSGSTSTASTGSSTSSGSSSSGTTTAVTTSAS